ncbi:hypothetical protein EMCG_08807 [[Emmonsia] crescens]|uniref:Uncharacterized protein n=1 Tax=[Emmonsia] crescens TaxID=73230 RepID=A0A0G2I3Z3_9EURO|nr:hypothetical protein EMCG_08807 [Emmonsia crescens UAMH 3008]
MGSGRWGIGIVCLGGLGRLTSPTCAKLPRCSWAATARGQANTHRGTWQSPA